jgi:hypothetical protein
MKVMMMIVSSGSLELILEQKEANDHVGSRRITWCRLLLDVRVLRQHKLNGNADNARVSAHGVDLVSLTDPALLLFGSAALTPVIKGG